LSRSQPDGSRCAAGSFAGWRCAWTTPFGGDDEVDFELTRGINGPTPRHIGRNPCSVGDFPGFGPKADGKMITLTCPMFLFIDGKLERMPTKVGRPKRVMFPGKEWCPANVPRTSQSAGIEPHMPSKGVIGCSVEGEANLGDGLGGVSGIFQAWRVACIPISVGGLTPRRNKENLADQESYISPTTFRNFCRRYKKGCCPEQGTLSRGSSLGQLRILADGARVHRLLPPTDQHATAFEFGRHSLPQVYRFPFLRWTVQERGITLKLGEKS